MPTKPTPAVEPTWNTGLANQVTPSGGKIALGWVPNEAPSSSYFNWWQYEIGQIAAWVLDGSSAGAADAHLVETNALGATTLRAATILGGAATTVGLDATGTTGAGPASGVRGTAVGAAPGVSGLGGAGAMSGSGNSLTGGVGLRGISGPTDDTAGVLGLGLQGSNCYGVIGLGSGTQAGVYGSSTSTNGSGVEGRGGSVSGIGVHGSAPGSGAGVRGDSVSGPGVWGVTDDSTGSYGVLGGTTSGADDSVAGVRGSGVSDAMGVWGVSVDGYALRGTAQNAERAALRLDPQDSDPTTALDGDVYFLDDSPRAELRLRARGAWRTVLWRNNGGCYGSDSSAGPDTSNSSVAWVDICNPVLAAPYDPQRVGTVRIRVTGEVGRDTTTAGNIQMRIYDDTASAVVASRTIELFQGAGTFERDISWEVDYTLPATGTRSFILQFRRSGGSDIVAIRNAHVVIDGVF